MPYPQQLDRPIRVCVSGETCDHEAWFTMDVDEFSSSGWGVVRYQEACAYVHAAEQAHAAVTQPHQLLPSVQVETWPEVTKGVAYWFLREGEPCRNPLIG